MGVPELSPLVSGHSEFELQRLECADSVETCLFDLNLERQLSGSRDSFSVRQLLECALSRHLRINVTAPVRAVLRTLTKPDFEL